MKIFLERRKNRRREEATRRLRRKGERSIVWLVVLEKEQSGRDWGVMAVL